MSESGTVSLEPHELHRYSRHLLLPGVGKAGQERLKAARVLIVGAGGLGSPAALYLAAAGIGTLGVIDEDVVSLSNLQRQILFSSSENGRPKVDAAADRLRGLNPEIEVVPYPEKFTRKNARELVGSYDFILDGTDNFESRYVIARACRERGIPHLYAGIFRFEGQLALFEPEGPCYACLYPTPPESDAVPNCSEAGVLGPLAGVLGTLQALETLKYFLGLREAKSQLVLFDGLTMSAQSFALKKRDGCAVCGQQNHADFWQEPEKFDSLFVRNLDDAPSNAVLLDVRDSQEALELPLPKTASAAASIRIPLSELKDRLEELDRNLVYVTICRSGQRSLRAQELLTEAGFKAVWNLKSGLSG